MSAVKSVLRRAYRTKRLTISKERGNLIYAGIKDELVKALSQLEDKRGQSIWTVGSYIATPQEIIPPHLAKHQYAFPRFEVGQPGMQFILHRPGVLYTDRQFDVLIPPKGLPEVVPDLVLVPLLCFNPASLHRVGYGKGYYDRYIARSRARNDGTVFVGVGLESQKEVSLVGSSNDQALDMIVTQHSRYF